MVLVEERRPDEVAWVAEADLVDHDHERGGRHQHGGQQGKDATPAASGQYETHRHAEQGSGHRPSRQVRSGADGDSTNLLWTATSTTAVNQNTGGGGAHNNLQPYVVINYIIAI